MAQDIIADALNRIMNAKKAQKNELEILAYSRFLLSVLAIAKLHGFIKNYSVDNKKLKIEIAKLHGCKAIKPRYTVSVTEIEKYVKRYLPAKNIGIIIVSTSKGLMTHQTAIEKNLGGSLIAYMF